MRAAERALHILDSRIVAVEEEYLHKKALLCGSEQLARAFFELFDHPGFEEAGSAKNAFFWEELAVREAVDLLLPGIHENVIGLIIQLEELGDKRAELTAHPAHRRKRHARYWAEEA